MDIMTPFRSLYQNISFLSEYWCNCSRLALFFFLFFFCFFAASRNRQFFMEGDFFWGKALKFWFCFTIPSWSSVALSGLLNWRFWKCRIFIPKSFVGHKYFETTSGWGMNETWTPPGSPLQVVFIDQGGGHKRKNQHKHARVSQTGCIAASWNCVLHQGHWCGVMSVWNVSFDNDTISSWTRKCQLYRLSSLGKGNVFVVEPSLKDGWCFVGIRREQNIVLTAVVTHWNSLGFMNSLVSYPFDPSSNESCLHRWVSKDLEQCGNQKQIRTNPLSFLPMQTKKSWDSDRSQPSLKQNCPTKNVDSF